MKFGSVCSGIEAASVAWHPLGWRAAWFAEIEPFPCAVLAHYYPVVPNLGDMTTIAKRVMTGEVEAPDVLAGGTPCFTAGHLVLTDKGYVPIEQIKPGDMVVTHLGRLQRVVRVGSKSAEVGMLKAVGLLEPMRVTADHPFLAVDWRMQNTRRDGRYKRVEHCGKPEWVEARNMPGRQWCALTNYQQIEKFPVSRKLDARQAMYVAGMYLGDGHIRRWSQRNKKALVLSLNHEKLARLSAVVGEDAYFVSQERTSVRVTICDTALCDWLLEQFGELSHLKRIPAWVLGHEHRAALLQGYLDTDGCEIKAGVSIATTSRALAYGVADLLNAEGYVASVALNETADTCVIEGRVVNQRDLYQVRAFHRLLSRKSRVRHGYLLRAVQSFEPAGVDTVFNIEVEVNNSYIVNGAVVHNCQAFSVAGLRESLADERGNLTLKFVELADAIDFVRVRDGRPPAIVFWENVPGVLSTKDNAFGCFLAGLAGEDEPLRAPGGKWANAGAVYGPARAIAWRTVDAQYFGLAQRRRRVFVVASARDGFDPATVLFEWDGVRRDSAPRREAGKATAASTARSVALRGREGGGTAELGDELQSCLRASGGGGDKPHVLIHADPIARCVTAGEAKRQDWETCNFVAQADGPSFTLNAMHGHDMHAVAVPVGVTIHGTDPTVQKVASYDELAQCLRARIPGNIDNSSTTVVQQPVAYGIRTANTSSNGWGIQEEATHTLDGAMGIAVAHPVAFHPTQDPISSTDGTTHAIGCGSSGGQASVAVLEALYNKGFSHGDLYASAQETNAGKILRTLREAVGEEAFAKWGLGILGSLQSPEILRQALHGLSIRPASFSRSWVVHCSLSRQEDGSGWLLQSLRETGCEGCPPQGWEPSEQLARQLGAYLSELSQHGAQASRFMRDLWWAAQGAGVLRQALSAVQEVGRPAHGQSQPAYGGMQVRRLTVEECEFLQGFPRGYTAIPWRRGKLDAFITGNECPDGPRYRALGNSWAVPVIRWIGRRIAANIE